jgi:serine protease Do
LPSESLGSGFIISGDGYVLTNHHVVKNADEIIVRLGDRSELPATLVGSDERSDIALLKVTPKGGPLPTVKIGDPARLKVGEWVLAIGSPFGFDHSVTAGIVSAKGRALPQDTYVPFIQTDVAINPGNSGGPLFNMAGEVVGINSQIYSRTGGFMGLSFAVPIDVAMDVVEQLKKSGKVTRGWLGVLIQDVTRELAESFGMAQPRGALVARVMPDGPAAKAGLEAGDVILRFNGEDIVYSSDLPPRVGRTAVGRKVEVDILRAGKPRTVTLAVEALPAQAESKVETQQPAKASTDRLGLRVESLTAQQRQDGRFERGGVRVQGVEAGPAQDAGVQPGDVILSVNSETVQDAADFKRLVERLPAGKVARLLVQRGENPLWLALRVPK